MKLVGRKPALTAEQCAFIRRIELKRRALRAELASLPNQSDLAVEFGVARWTIDRAARGIEFKHHAEDRRAVVPRGTTPNNLGDQSP